MKLKFSAPATVIDEDANGAAVSDNARLASLHGAISNECFSDYMTDDPFAGDLLAKGVSGGFLRFNFRGDLNELWAETEYDLRESLNDEDIKNLREYTTGHWSDGIGENFSQEQADRTGLLANILPSADQIVIEVTTTETK